MKECLVLTGYTIAPRQNRQAQNGRGDVKSNADRLQGSHNLIGGQINPDAGAEEANISK